MRMLMTSMMLCLSIALTAQENPAGINSVMVNAIVDDDSRSVQVKLYYDLSVSKGETILKVLNFPSAPLSPVRAYVNGEIKDITFTQQGKIASAPIHFNNSGKVGLQLNYEVPLGTNDPVTLIIPIVYPDMPASEASQDFFNASIVLEGYQIHEAFPSNSWSVEKKDGWTLHELTLQAVPSMIKLKLGKGNKAMLSTLNLVDLAVIVILLILLALGWKKIRQV